MALAVRSAQVGSRKGQIVNLILTIIFGSVFLVVKYFEYAEKFEHHLVPGPNFDMTLPLANQQQLFFSLYFMMTGIHALHMVVGIGLMLVILAMAWRGTFSAELLHAGRSVRPLLALRRHRLDLPVPAAVPAGRHCGAHALRLSMSSEHIIVPVRTYVVVFVALLVLTGVTVPRRHFRTSAG